MATAQRVRALWAEGWVWRLEWGGVGWSPVDEGEEQHGWRISYGVFYARQSGAGTWRRGAPWKRVWSNRRSRLGSCGKYSYGDLLYGYCMAKVILPQLRISLGPPGAAGEEGDGAEGACVGGGRVGIGVGLREAWDGMGWGAVDEDMARCVIGHAARVDGGPSTLRANPPTAQSTGSMRLSTCTLPAYHLPHQAAAPCASPLPPPNYPLLLLLLPLLATCYQHMHPTCLPPTPPGGSPMRVAYAWVGHPHPRTTPC